MDFANLRKSELALLLYCLILEEQVTVTLSRKALDPNAQKPCTLTGLLRHKIGGAEPHGAGSVHICIRQMQLCRDAAARYRGHAETPPTFGKMLIDELDRRTHSFRKRPDATMKQLRAMLIYTERDPRHPVKYPTRQWFKDNSQKHLKSTV